ncbi:hypothetical protein BZG36_02240 [Bifiguratus adelaidae]|uniref:Ribosome biogenesis regulatory protein n=1 Tax=Bifiguratus adelaidae TaxID=1938954 RepID=A0A261Y1M1_9FUNG|nr:hypothetical protein BZG36_02240 [Bifiguratus adelaidae]
MDVSAVLEAHKAQFKPITVDKVIPLEYDLNLLTALDSNPLDESQLRSNTEEYLKQYTRDGCQLLFNHIFTLPVVSDESGVLATLPERVTTIPREKPLPKPKPPTRWERFAAQKGIQKQKKERMVFDERTGEYVPRWGYGGGKKNKTEDWLLEVPQNADPMEDQYAKKNEEKQERMEKNKKRQQRNLDERAAQEKGVNPRDARKQQVYDALATSKKSTASLGKFDKQLSGEPKQKGIKRKFEATEADVAKEKAKHLDILNKVVGKAGEPTVNVRKAIKLTKRK